jgi:hypothetical protein
MWGQRLWVMGRFTLRDFSKRAVLFLHGGVFGAVVSFGDFQLQGCHDDFVFGYIR